MLIEIIPCLKTNNYCTSLYKSNLVESAPRLIRFDMKSLFLYIGYSWSDIIFLPKNIGLAKEPM